MDYGLIPTRLDDPPKFLWWDFDVAILFMTFIVFGFVTGWIFTFITIGAVITYFYRRAKFGKHKAYGMHLLYWYLPINFGMKLTPPSSIREFIG